MKSILVDALRQANGDEGDKALSDSGSFEVSHEGLESPANEVLERDDGELELMSTTKALVVPGEAADEPETPSANEEAADDAADLEFEQVPVDDEHAVTIVGMMPLPVPKQRTPRLARFSPLVCAALAVTISGSWLLINKLGLSRAGLGTTISEVRDNGSTEDNGGDEAPQTRFPFLETGEPVEARGARP